MALKEQPLLTIAIPTYNRAKFLNQCLFTIAAQISDMDYPLEIIVSDNCSTDATNSIVQKFISAGIIIRYLSNSENKGPDFNIAQCFTEAKGKYVLVFGDDDFLIEGGIAKLMSILIAENEAGIVNLRGRPYDPNFKIIGKVRNEGLYTVYDDKLAFVKKVNYNLTFISGNIINKNLFSTPVTQEFYNTYLLQLSWVFNVLINSTKNIIIEDDLLGIGSIENTGGYKLYEVFVVNFNKVMESFKSKGLSRKFVAIINNRLLLSFFPDFIIADRKKNDEEFMRSSAKKIFNTHYGSSLIYWISVLPLLNLPKKLYKYWIYPIQACNKILGFLDKLYFKKNKNLKKVTPKYL